MPKTILIKKYENRRLYDSTNSRYVNLDEVARILQHGDDVRVVDAATGDDITRLILTQIIVEGAKAPDSGFPLNVLRDMVVASGRASQESAVRYTKAMLDFYKSTYQAMSPALNPFSFAEAVSAASTQPEPPRQQPVSGQQTNSEPSDEHTLRQRLADLEKQVASIAEGQRTKSSTRESKRRSKGK